jgi:ArsR family transcriptional regulator
MPDQPSTRLSALRALADPVRLALVDELSREDVCACELRARLDLSAPLISHHLRVLREAGLVETRKSGRRLEVELNRKTLARVAGSLGAA